MKIDTPVMTENQNGDGETEREIRSVCNEIADLLVKKNRSYGDSALNPIRIFSKKADGFEQINVRIDDKLSRIARGTDEFNEDTELDLVGYLVLKRVGRKRNLVRKATEVPDRNGENAWKEKDLRMNG